MWLLALALVADTVHTFSLALSPAESVAVTVTGTGDPVVLVPGLFGSAFGYRAVIPLLTDAGYRAIVGTARHRQLGAPGTCGLLPHRSGRPDCGGARSAEHPACDRRGALPGGVDGISTRLPAPRPRRRDRFARRRAGGACRHAFVSACHDARALDQAVRRREAGAQKDPRTAD